MEIVPRVFEFTELLVNKLGVEDVGAYYPIVLRTIPSCHSLRLLRVGDAPLRLLRNVGGIDLIELPNSEECCGFGGTFAIKNPDTSFGDARRQSSLRFEYRGRDVHCRR